MRQLLCFENTAETQRTRHVVRTGEAGTLLGAVAPGSAHLVVTSPPYPMIEMWDDVFAALAPASREALETGDGAGAFEAMHRALDPIWRGLHVALAPGGFLCINIGDATRSVNGEFALYANHARILAACLKAGFTNLPAVLWRKQTNAPNKFMGSGMLPAGAYVTLEHEFVLILRKGGKRVFGDVEEKARRARSALFWEERNAWFSDVWFDLKGARQGLVDPASRKRSGAFPFDLAWRLIHMYSMQGDLVLDPFLGSGTTMHAAAAAGRSSLGLEIDPALAELACSTASAPEFRERMNRRAAERLAAHRGFVARRTAEKGEDAFKHRNETYDFPVITRQERDLAVPELLWVETRGDGELEAAHAAPGAFY